jgi:hypothetical protein
MFPFVVCKMVHPMAQHIVDQAHALHKAALAKAM